MQLLHDTAAMNSSDAAPLPKVGVEIFTMPESVTVLFSGGPGEFVAGVSDTLRVERVEQVELARKLLIDIRRIIIERCLQQG